MDPQNTADTPARVLRRLERLDLRCLLFGGWAEEARGLCRPRAHGDIDLLLPAGSFRGLDRVLAAAGDDLREVPLKRFTHKRAFLFEGTLVEVVLVEPAPDAPCTWFWGDLRFEWLTPLAGPGILREHRLPIVSRQNLKRYRAQYRSTEPWRWKEPDSLVPRQVWSPPGDRG